MLVKIPSIQKLSCLRVKHYEELDHKGTGAKKLQN